MNRRSSIRNRVLGVDGVPWGRDRNRAGYPAVQIISRTIDPDGTGDYTGMASWYSDMESTYVSPIVSNSIWIAKNISSGGTKDILTAELDIDADSDASRYIILQAGEGHSAYGKWDPLRYILSCTATSITRMLDINSPYCQIRGLQIEVLSTHSSVRAVDFGTTGATNGLVWGCMFNGGGAPNSNIAINLVSSTGPTFRAVNSIAFDFTDSGAQVFDGSDGARYDFCTVAGSNGGGKDGFHEGLCTNCLSSGNQGDDFNLAASGSDYNASEDTTAPGSNSRQSQTFTFNDAANDDYRLSNSDTGAKNHGTPISDVKYDIAGVLRDPDNPSIGACEVAA